MKTKRYLVNSHYGKAKQAWTKAYWKEALRLGGSVTGAAEYAGVSVAAASKQLKRHGLKV